LKRWKMTNPRRGPDPHGQSGRIEPLLGFWWEFRGKSIYHIIKIN
jgi:hypothetical protein